MNNNLSEKNKFTEETIAEAQGLLKSVGSRGGNDMISGAESMADIPLRFTKENVAAAENEQKIRAVGDGTLDPADEHALGPIIDLNHEPTNDLLKLMSWLLKGIEDTEAFCTDAEKKGDGQLCGFFREVRQNNKQVLLKAKKLFSERVGSLAQGLH